MGYNFCKINHKNEMHKVLNTEILLDEIKKYICEIYLDNSIKGIGFFCYIPFPDKSHLLPSLITNNHLINKNNKRVILNTLYNNKSKKITIEINNDRKIYMSEKYDTTFIEIKPIKDKIEYFLELDDNINKQNFNEIYSDKSIYMIDYIKFYNSKNISLSVGTLKKISEKNKFDIYHLCSTKESFSGSPILFLSNNKVIGIQKEVTSNYYDFNKGTFLKYPIKEFINDGKKINEILITLKIEEIDINKNIYFLNNVDSKYNKNKKNVLNELNNKNVELFINNKKNKFQKYFNPKKTGIYKVILKFNICIKNCSKMFYNCGNIINIDLSFFDSSQVTNTKYMFSHCNNLLYINFTNFDTSKVTNMSYMFSHCSNLINFDLSSFNTENVYNISYMFYNCCNISYINLSNFNTKKIIDMSYLFYNCKKLTDINIENFDTKNVVDMSDMFSRCKKLINFNVNHFNTENVSNMSHMFSHCHNLRSINLSNFDTENVIDISSMFAFCYNLIEIDLSNFDTKNIKYMNDIFLNCYNLTNVTFPLYNINNIRKMSYMFYNCWSLTNINEDFFNNKNIKNNNNRFSGCNNLYNIDYTIIKKAS